MAHLYARAAINLGIGTVWCGAGTNTASETQLELIDQLQPTLWIGMASYGLHLANLAEAKGFDLKASSVKKIFGTNRITLWVRSGIAVLGRFIS